MAVVSMSDPVESVSSMEFGVVIGVGVGIFFRWIGVGVAA